MDKPASLAKLLIDARKQRGLSLDEASELLGITKSHLWELEQGRSANPRATTIAAIWRTYNISPSRVVARAALGDPHA